MSDTGLTDEQYYFICGMVMDNETSPHETKEYINNIIKQVKLTLLDEVEKEMPADCADMDDNATMKELDNSRIFNNAIDKVKQILTAHREALK